MSILLYSFIFGSIFGIFNEWMFKQNSAIEFCSKNKLKCTVNATFLNVYGWGFLLVSLFEKRIRKYNFISQFLLLAILVGIIECGTYKMFINFWNNKPNPILHNFENIIPVFGGKSSIISMLYFSIILMIYINIVLPEIKNLI